MSFICSFKLPAAADTLCSVMPSGICTPAFRSLLTAFIIGILADIGLQVCWYSISIYRLLLTPNYDAVVYVLLELEVSQTFGALHRLQGTRYAW